MTSSTGSSAPQTIRQAYVLEIRDAKDEEIAKDAKIADSAMWQLVRGALLYVVDALDPAHETSKTIRAISAPTGTG